MTPIQAVGSTTTYLKRYLISNAFALRTSEAGVAHDDDDGEAQRRQPDARPSTRDTPAAGAKAADTVGKDETYRQAFRRALHVAKDETEISKLLANADLKEWLDAAPVRIRRDIEDMLAKKRKILADAAKPAEPVEDPPALTGLLARIEDADQATLDAMPTTPSFNEAMMGLSFPQQDRVDEAFKARAELLAKLREENKP